MSALFTYESRIHDILSQNSAQKHDLLSDFNSTHCELLRSMLSKEGFLLSTSDDDLFLDDIANFIDKKRDFLHLKTNAMINLHISENLLQKKLELLQSDNKNGHEKLIDRNIVSINVLDNDKNYSSELLGSNANKYQIRCLLNTMEEYYFIFTKLSFIVKKKISKLNEMITEVDIEYTNQCNNVTANEKMVEKVYVISLLQKFDSCLQNLIVDFKDIQQYCEK